MPTCDELVGYGRSIDEISTYEDGNDLQWGSCIRSDGAKCGVGLQAREALINTDSNFGFGDNFGGGKCFIPPSPTPDGDGIDSEGKSTKLSIEHTELSKYEYKKCRGDKGKKWEPCNDKLKSHVSGGGGITNLKNDFRISVSFNIATLIGEKS